MICNNCGKKINPEQKYCRICGSRIPIKKKFCRYCGKEINLLAKFCRHCGKQLLISTLVQEQSENNPTDQDIQESVVGLEGVPCQRSENEKTLKGWMDLSSGLWLLKTFFQKNRAEIIIILIATAVIFAGLFIFSTDNVEEIAANDVLEASVTIAATEQSFKEITQPTQISEASTINSTEHISIDEMPTAMLTGERIRVMDYCSIYHKSPIYVTPGDEIVIYDGWLAKNQDLVQDHIDNVILDIRLDGLPIALDYSSGIVPDYDNNGNVEGYDVFFERNVGRLSEGSHRVEAYVTWKSKIFDGWEYYGPDTSNPTIDGYCEIIVK